MRIVFAVLMGIALVIMTVTLYYLWFRPGVIRSMNDRQIEYQKKYHPFASTLLRRRHAWMQSPEWLGYARLWSTLIYLLTLAAFVALMRSILSPAP